MKLCANIFLTLTFIVAGSLYVFPQSKALNKAEQKLIDLYKGIYEDGARLKNPKEKRLFLDSLEPVLEKRVIALLTMPGAMKDPFVNLRKSIKLIESPDKRLRFFSWNTQMGDEKNYIQVIAQYKNEEGGIHVEILKPFGREGKFDQAVDYWDINMLADSSYLVFGDGKYNTKDRAVSIANFKIAGNELTDTTAIFETDAGLSHTISISYSIQVCEADDLQVYYDQEAQSLCYPLMTTIAKDKIIGQCASGENICLLYDGSIFRKISSTK